MTPFSPAEHADRRARAAAQAARAGLDGVLVTPGPDLLYFLGYTPATVTERLTMLVVPADGDPVAVVPRIEAHDLSLGTGGVLDAVEWTDGEDEYAAAGRLLRPGGRYAVTDAAWAMHVLGLQRTLPGTSYEAFTRALPMLRAVKTPGEVGRLAAAGAAADAAFGEVCGLPFAGRREREVAADLDRLLRDHGHEQVDFTLVCAGENGADPHHDAGDRVIADGDMVVLDFGGLRDGYGSDTTRTVHVGPLSAQEQEVHDIVRAAQEAGVRAVVPGARCQDVDRAARAVVDESGYGEFFIHRTGHGIGLTTHEPPYLVEGEEQPIEPGMCFSVEPGIYLPGRFGVRIEDIVVAFPGALGAPVPGVEPVPDAAVRLNRTPHEAQLVG
ncbi:aminopeptidase P family protein [Antribacter gilvus]|uniref:aminopeptidase P family protein n=1 Tax=Antribacter gilvus TaxID=2304675 RepID=UPI000F7B331B|nr:aminopeptidase P family protein [Antribacter gilvus]